MMTVTNKEDQERNQLRVDRLRTSDDGSDVTDKHRDRMRSKSLDGESDSSELLISSDARSSGESLNTPTSTDDDPDSPFPIYKSTTESIESNQGGCCSCNGVVRSWEVLKSMMSQFSSRQWKILIIICLSTLTSSLSVCLFPPFFPRLAESKGHTATMYGMVIGTNCLTAFIVTPFIGRNVETIGVNFAFVFGMLGSGYCCCLSGFLEYFSHGYKFILVAVVIRVMHATANAAVITSTMAYVACEFPESVAFLFSITRAMMNLAQMFGPAIGGALLGVGGFKLPFFVLGGVHMMASVVCFIFLPSFRARSTKSKMNAKTSSWKVLRIPGLWVAFLTFIFSTMSNGFLSITLEPQILRHFDVSPLIVGLLFGLKDGANCIASPIWGWLCDRTSRLKLLIIIGSIMAASSFVLLGPFPGLPVEHTMGIVIFSVLLNGFGVGGQQVAGVVSAMKDAISAGYPDEADTHAFIAGLWSSLSGAGRFVSRAGAGILVDNIGFQYTSLIVTSLHTAIVVITVIYICFSKTHTKKNQSKRHSYQIHVETNSPSEPLGSKSFTDGPRFGRYSRHKR